MNHKYKQTLEFTSLMDQLTSSGLSLNESLNIINSSITGSKKNSIASMINNQIRKGKSFSDAVLQLREYFPEYYSTMIRICSATGNVEKIFSRLFHYLDNKNKLVSRIKSAMIYPAAVLVISTIMLVLSSIYLIPKLKDLFHQIGGKSEITLCNTIDHLQQNIYITLVFFLLLAFLICLLKKTIKKSQKFSFSFNKMILSIPFAGKTILDFELLNYCSMMEILTESGLPLDYSMKESLKIIKNSFLLKEFSEINKETFKGCSLSNSLKRHSVIPSAMIQWIYIGEKSGKTSETFKQLRMYYSERTSKTISTITALTEPLITAVLGLFILLIVLKFIVPFFEIYGSMEI